MRLLLLCICAAVTIVAAPAMAQYVYVDVNGDGVCNAADVITDATTSIDIYFDTEHNADGSPAMCLDGYSPMSIISYEFILHSSGAPGSVFYGAYTNLVPQFPIDLGTVPGGEDFHTGFGGATPLPPGTYKVGSLAILVMSGTNPVIGPIATTPLGPGLYFTAFGSECYGMDFDNLIKLGTDFLDACSTSPLSVDHLPVVIAPLTETVAVNQLLTFTVTASDPDGDPIWYLTGGPLPPGATFTPNGTNTSGTFTWVPDTTQVGSHIAVFTAGNALADTAETVITVTRIDRPPVITAPPTQTVAENSLLTFTVDVSDPDGDPIGYLAASTPAGATFTPNGTNTSGTFDWTPSFTQAGIYNVWFTAGNALDDTTATVITVTNVDRAPVVTAPANAIGSAGTLISFAVSATDPDGDAIDHLTAAPLPSGASFDVNGAKTSGTFSWTPSMGQTGSYDVAISAKSACRGDPYSSPYICETGTATVSVVVVSPGQPPVVTAPPRVEGTAGALITFVASAFDPDGDPIEYLTAAPLPTGASFSSNPSKTSGTFAWTPSAAQVDSFAVLISAQSACRGDPFSSPVVCDTGTATVMVVVLPGDLPPVVTAPGTVNGAENTLITFTVAASDPDGDAITSLAMAPLPAGALFNAGPANTSGTFTWTPDFTQAGVYYVVSTASNALVDTALTVVTVANVDRAPVVTAPPFQGGVEGVLLTFTVSAFDPDGDAITSLTAAPLPGGAVFSPNGSNTSGTFRWTPGPGQAGVYDVLFGASNALFGADTTHIVIVAPDHPPVVTAPATVSGDENALITFTVTASDPDGDPIAFLDGWPLPSGATFTPNGTKTSGTFDWTPSFTQAGTYIVWFAAENAQSDTTATQVTVLNVDRAPVVTAPVMVNGIEGVPLMFPVTATDPDGEAILSLAGVPLPMGAAFVTDSTNTGAAFTWTPTIGQAGAYNVTFTASNELSGSATTTITIAPDRPPVVTAPATMNGAENRLLTFQVFAMDPDGMPIDALAAMPLPAGATFGASGYGEVPLRGVWSSAESEVFAVGVGGMILRRTGSGWSAMESGTTQDLFAVWGSSRTDVFAGGDGGTILHYNGSGWSAMSSGTSGYVTALWGSSGGDVFAVSGGGILHYNGSVWSAMSSSTSQYVIALWGTSGTDVYGVGDQGAIVHYNGSAWSEIGNATAGPLTQAWGTSGTNVFATRWTPLTTVILHYDGSVWTPMTDAISHRFASMWGSSGNNVFAVGGGGTILHYDGNAWTEMPSGTTNTLRCVWGRSGSDVFAVGDGGTVLHYDGSTWSPAGVAFGTFTWTPGPGQAGVYPVTFTASNRLSGSATTTITIASDHPPVVTAPPLAEGRENYSYINFPVSAEDPDGESIDALWATGLPTGASFLVCNRVGTSTLISVWGSSENDVFAVGLDGAIQHYNGSAWSPMSSGTTMSLWSVWGSSGENVFAVGAGGTILRYNGHTWIPMSSGTDQSLNGVWGTAANDVFAVGHGGTILHYNGNVWSPMTSGTSKYLSGVWGSSGTNVFAVGSGGTILRYNGSAWSPMLPPVGGFLWGVWGSSGSDVFAVDSDGGAVLHYNGTAWSVMQSWPVYFLNGVWGSSPSDVFVVGFGGTILHYNGSGWNTMVTGTNEWFNGVWGTSGDNVFAVGDNGGLLHYDGDTWSGMGPLGGVVNWAPREGQAGTYNVTFTASNTLTGSAATSIVVAQDRPPVVTVPPSVSGFETQPLSFVATAADPDGDPIGSLWVEPLPSGASFTADSTNTSGTFSWTPVLGQAGDHPVVVWASNYLSDSATVWIHVGETNAPPVLEGPASIQGFEGTLISFSVFATDPNEDHVTIIPMNLPVGATFAAAGDSAGVFNWTPGYAQAGVYTVQFIGRDEHGLQSEPLVVTITVADVNRPPIADAGGPYLGTVNIPVYFYGNGSSDPDGDPLTYLWFFGDGALGSGAVAAHTYTTPGYYWVALTVRDGGEGSSTDTTSAVIQTLVPARAFTAGGNDKIRLGSGKAAWCVQIEPVDGSYLNTRVLISTIVMRYAGVQIFAMTGKVTIGADKDANGIEELTVCFAKTDLRTLFESLPKGTSTVTVDFEGELLAGGRFRATMPVIVISRGGTLSASLSPNPLNPTGILTFTTSQEGPARVSMFDLQGRLLRVLLSESYLAAGYHDLPVDGRTDAGGPLASGVYFYRIETREGTITGRFAVMK